MPCLRSNEELHGCECGAGGGSLLVHRAHVLEQVQPALAGGDEVLPAVAVHVRDPEEQAHAGRLLGWAEVERHPLELALVELELGVPGPLALEPLLGALEPAARPDEILAAIAVDVAIAQAMPDAALLQR